MPLFPVAVTDLSNFWQQLSVLSIIDPSFQERKPATWLYRTLFQAEWKNCVVKLMRENPFAHWGKCHEPGGYEAGRRMQARHLVAGRLARMLKVSGLNWTLNEFHISGASLR